MAVVVRQIDKKMNYFKTDIAASRRYSLKKCPTSKQIIGKRFLLKIVNFIENLSRNPCVFCYCTLRFGECEVCRLLEDYRNFYYDKRAVTRFKFVTKCVVNISIRKKAIRDKMRDKNLMYELSYTNTNSSCLTGLCIYDLMKAIDAKQLFLEESYYC